MNGRASCELPVLSAVSSASLIKTIDDTNPIFDAINVSLGDGRVQLQLRLAGCIEYLDEVGVDGDPYPSARRPCRPRTRQSDPWKKCYKLLKPELHGSQPLVLPSLTENIDSLVEIIEGNKFPSSQTYILVSSSEGARYCLDPNHGEDRPLFEVAAFFSRVVRQGIEYEALESVQAIVDKPRSRRNPMSSEYQELIDRTLSSLRGRINQSWPHSTLYGEAMICRSLRKVVRILYFHHRHIIQLNSVEDTTSVSCEEAAQGQRVARPRAKARGKSRSEAWTEEAFERWLWGD